MANIIWGFPGIGKSTVADGENIVDVDCKLFQFFNTTKETLHQKDPGSYGTNPEYPKNYIEYLKSLPSKTIALVNCHVSYLSEFPDTILIYPDVCLKEEYLKRYQKRGDAQSFQKHMEDEFERSNNIIDCLDRSPFRKYKVMKKGLYLEDVLKDGRLKNMFMKKSDMVELLMEAKNLLHSDIYQNTHCITLDKYGLDEIKDMDDFCMKLFHGEGDFDFDALKMDIDRTSAGIANELRLLDCRGGLSREELAHRITMGIVNGALGIRYGEIAPYSYGYEVTFLKDGPPGSTREFNNRWECYTDFFDIGTTIVGMIENGVQSNEVFGARCKELDIKEMLACIDKREAEKIETYTPEAETDFKRVIDPSTYPYRNDVATVEDICARKGLDGIVMHHYHGDYSTMTPSKQNSLVEMLVCLNGFCLDALCTLDCSDKEKDGIIAFLKKQGIDISSTEKLKSWIDQYPEKCAFPHNRNQKRDLSALLDAAKKELNEKKAEKDAPVQRRNEALEKE